MARWSGPYGRLRNVARVGIMKSAVNSPLRVPSLDVASGRHLAPRSVVMVASPGLEPTRAAVVFNLATVCAEIGQRVAVVSTAGVDAHDGESNALKLPSASTQDEPGRRLNEPLRPVDVQQLLEGTSVPGVSLLDLQHFVAHPTQVVIRVPEVVYALREVVDVVILDVPSFLTVHHGQGLAPLADVVLVVGERRLTTLDELRRTSAMLKRLGAPVVGMALTDREADDDDWRDEDLAQQAEAAEKKDRKERGRDESGPAVPTIPDEASSSPGTHRRRRSVVDHTPPPVWLGTRSEFVTETEASTLPED
jgi:Mrp family chromosome partitioning ATPase